MIEIRLVKNPASTYMFARFNGNPASVDFSQVMAGFVTATVDADTESKSSILERFPKHDSLATCLITAKNQC